MKRGQVSCLLFLIYFFKPMSLNCIILFFAQIAI